MTVGGAIAEPMSVHGLSGRRALRDRVVERLEMVDLGASHYDRYPHEFSGGQRQRIGIARALSVDPSFIVFDESVSALDVSVQSQVLNLLRDLKRNLGFTSLFISHDLSVVHHVSDRILVMKGGRIVESGPAEEIFLNPRTEYTRRLIESMPGGFSTRQVRS
jgi:peptide/nickel transport system ATP-binding protein